MLKQGARIPICSSANLECHPTSGRCSTKPQEELLSYRMRLLSPPRRPLPRPPQKRTYNLLYEPHDGCNHKGTEWKKVFPSVSGSSLTASTTGLRFRFWWCFLLWGWRCRVPSTFVPLLPVLYMFWWTLSYTFIARGGVVYIANWVLPLALLRFHLRFQRCFLVLFYRKWSCKEERKWER